MQPSVVMIMPDRVLFLPELDDHGKLNSLMSCTIVQHKNDVFGAKSSSQWGAYIQLYSINSRRNSNQRSPALFHVEWAERTTYQNALRQHLGHQCSSVYNSFMNTHAEFFVSAKMSRDSRSMHACVCPGALTCGPVWGSTLSSLLSSLSISAILCSEKPARTDC